MLLGRALKRRKFYLFREISNKNFKRIGCSFYWEPLNWLLIPPKNHFPPFTHVITVRSIKHYLKYPPYSTKTLTGLASGETKELDGAAQMHMFWVGTPLGAFMDVLV